MPALSSRPSLIRRSPIRRIAALLEEAKRKETIISFGGGAPSLPPPPEVVDYLAEMIKKEPARTVAYSSTKGIPELRQLLAEDLKKHWGVEYDPDDILIVNGGTEGIYLSLAATVEPGDEVIILDPTYLGYSEAIKLFGGKVRYVPVSVENGYQPSLEDVERVISPITKAFILLSPDNPTGRIVTEEFVKGLVDMAVKYDFWIIFDAVYKHISFGRKTPWVDAIPEARERTITINSFSKEASIPGLRLGYVTGPREAVDAMEKIKQYVSLAPSTTAQYAMIKFHEDGIKDRYLRDVVIPTYKKRRDLMYQMIQEYLPEARTVLPEGAFYFFVDMRRYLEAMGRNDEEFANRLLYRKSVVVIPGRYFGSKGVGHVRMTFVTEPEERIREGIKRIAAYVSSYMF